MLIKDASIQLQSQHQLKKHNQTSETLRVSRPRPQQAATPPQDKLELSHTHPETTVTKTTQVDPEANLSASDSLMANIIKTMFKQITGKDLELFSPQQLQGEDNSIRYQEQTPPSSPPGKDLNLVYQRTSTYQESEQTAFSAQGIIKTKDGKEIVFSTQLSMSREFSRQSSLTISIGEPEKIDPLVINFDGNAAELSTQTFEFDIDANGSLDQINLLKSGSGLLALDKNQDGVINDGSELFGPKTGNGFSELAQYDTDHNNFIDEADPIYQKLRIWQHHEDGSQQLIALGDKNIGAIFLGHTTTPFQLKAEDNQSLGEITDTGIYLNEEGSIGTIQQINFNV